MKTAAGRRKAVKGQLIFEFVVAALMLFAIVMYTLNYLSLTTSAYHNEYVSDYLESKALQISDVLMHDQDSGIIAKWPVLDSAKLSSFNQSCDNDYVGMLYNFSLIENTPYTQFNHMSIIVNDTAGNMYVDCGRSPPSNVTVWRHAASTATVTRYCLTPAGDRIATVEVRVW